MTGSSSSSNSNNTGPTDSEYITEVSQSHALRYWVPTSSKLSRGVKGEIQRVFTGEPLNNLCNVYIYNETSKSWFHEYTITGSSGEDFGRSIDGTDNADMVAIGAPGTWFGSVSTITGYVRVFTKDSSGNGWTQRGASVSQQGGFGHSVALSQYDGNILAVGAPFYNTLIPLSSGSVNFRSIEVSEGKVYIYKWDGANYTLQQTLNSPSGTLSTSITPSQSQSFYFGYSLGITDIGDKIIVGEPAIRNIWYVPDQMQNGPWYWSSTEFPYTGNAHVYDNFTVLSGGTTWTSNVSMSSVIGTTGIGTSLDLNPTHVRWLDALGTSVDINRNGTRILAGGPGSYGTSNAAPHFMTGRIYTLEWNSLEGIWEEMGQVSKHIVAPQGQMLLGMNTRFDGSGRRIVSGCTGFVDNGNSAKGDILVYDWNGDQWVNFPGENVEVIDRAWNASDYWANWQWRLGESISIDGEGEIISFGVSEHKYPQSLTSGVFRPNAFNVDNITYIGGATTSTAGSSSTITTGSSNIWVYTIQQSMVVKGNVTVGGYVQATGMSIGTEDDSSTSTKSLFFGGSKSDNSYDLTVIENRVYDSEERAELLIFKGNDNADPNTGAGTFGPDRIRLKGGQIAFDLNGGYDRKQENILAVMHRDSSGAGMLGINTTNPLYNLHVAGTSNFTGELNVNRSAGTSGQVLTSSGANSAPTWTNRLWSVLNSNVYYSSGNVGIGTSTPFYNLHVDGDINFTGELSVSGSVGTSGQVLTTNGPGFPPTWTTISGGGGGSSYWIQTGTDIYYTSGNVGINTTNPLYNLHVAGTSNFTGELNVNSSAGTFGQVLTSGGAGSAPTWTTISSGGGSSYWTQSGLNIYYTTGNVSIGTTTVTGKLTVSGSNTGATTTYRFFTIGTSQLTIAGVTPNWSIYATDNIGASGFYAFSDRRIKKNITDINDSSALDKIRLLEPKMYNYINEVERGTSNVYGFIAQEVANVLPYAVTIGEGDIPNIYTNSNVIVTENSNVLELHLDTPVEGLSLSNTSVINIITDKDTTLTCNVLSFSGSNVITIENTDEFSNVTNAFIKGERITDFHSLDKNAIWAVATAALQEVDRQLQTEKTKVATLETQVADLLTRVTALENN